MSEEKTNMSAKLSEYRRNKTFRLHKSDDSGGGGFISGSSLVPRPPPNTATDELRLCKVRRSAMFCQRNVPKKKNK